MVFDLLGICIMVEKERKLSLQVKHTLNYVENITAMFYLHFKSKKKKERIIHHRPSIIYIYVCTKVHSKTILAFHTVLIFVI